MPATLDEVRELVRTHEELDEPMDGAIWIRRGEEGVWLVEILPDLPSDDSIYKPVVFAPDSAFRRTLFLIAGNLGDLLRHVDRDRAIEILDGVVVSESAAVKELQQKARELAAA